MSPPAEPLVSVDSELTVHRRHAAVVDMFVHKYVIDETWSQPQNNSLLNTQRKEAGG